MSSLMQALAAWLLTYALHSTILIGAAYAVTRSRHVLPAAADVIWKVALVGGIVSATAQSALEWRPAGSFALSQATQVAHTPMGPAALPGDLDRQGDGAEQPSVAPAPSVVDQSRAPLSADGTTATVASRLPSPSSIFGGAWLLIAIALVFTYVARRLVLVGRLGDRRLVGDRRVTELLDTLRLETGVREPIRLTSSNAISSPVALGGEICLPSAALEELEPEQQRAMLAHELAHLVRRDPQWLAAACLVERALFIQPLNRLARKGLQSSAEYLADEWAARRTGGVPLARALVKVAEWIQASPLGVPVAGFAEERSQLTVRVSRLLDRTSWANPRSRWGIAALAGAALIVTTAFAPGVSRQQVLLAGGEPFAAITGDEAKDQDSAKETSKRDDSQLDEVTREESKTAKSEVAPLAMQGVTAEQGDTSVVRAVMERLRDDDVEVRRAAAHALGRLKNPIAIGALVRALEDEDKEVQQAALNSLSNFERGVPATAIRGLLASEDPEMRATAVNMLGDMKDRASMPAITRLVADPDADVRQHALHALEEIGAPIAEETVGAALGDVDADVRQTAAHLSGERRMTTLVPTLIKMMDDQDGDVRESAAHALTEMKTEASHRALRLAITHRDARIRRIAVNYLGDEDDR